MPSYHITASYFRGGKHVVEETTCPATDIGALSETKAAYDSDVAALTRALREMRACFAAPITIAKEAANRCLFHKAVHYDGSSFPGPTIQLKIFCS